MLRSFIWIAKNIIAMIYAKRYKRANGDVDILKCIVYLFQHIDDAIASSHREGILAVVFFEFARFKSEALAKVGKDGAKIGFIGGAKEDVGRDGLAVGVDRRDV